MEAIARELNLSKAELCVLTFTPSGSLQSLSRRLAHAGLSEGELAAAHGDVLRDMRRVCSQWPSHPTPISARKWRCWRRCNEMD
jgi:hypothetical protein